MAHLWKRTAVGTAGAAFAIAGVIAPGPALAGAQSNDAPGHSAHEVSPDAVAIVPGTYEWFLNGVDTGTITLAAGNTFTAVEGGDSGTWAQAGKTAALTITGGVDASPGCIFAGHVNSTGTGISYAAKPGRWICPGFHSGTFYIGPTSSGTTSQAHGDPLSGVGGVPATAGTVKPGTYRWKVNGGILGGKPHRHITLASNSTYTSTLSSNDSGTWVQGGSAVALSIRLGNDGDEGCLFVGKGNTTGTAIGTTAKPGHWVCPGYEESGTFVTN
jgi:hypothetical protein